MPSPLPSLFALSLFGPHALVEEPVPRIVGGQVSQTCHFPGTLFIKEENQPKCTGTLVHPSIVTTAGHCVGGLMTFGFGERGQYRRITGVCKESPEHTDMAYCKLTKPVKGVPIVPILMGCELQALQEGAEVALVGFGNTADKTADGGTKREVLTPIHGLVGEGGVGADEILLGHADKGSCNGDSGGPAYIDLREVEAFKDKPGAGWRVFGITSRKGPGGGNCASTSVYGVIAQMVPWIEEDSGIDITPCFDADGTWNPGPECKDFSDPRAGGEWPTCDSGVVRGEPLVCAPKGKEPSETTTDAGKDSSDSSNSQDPSEKPEKRGCRQSPDGPGDPSFALALGLLVLGARRRRSHQG